jgi:hypothetical protein
MLSSGREVDPALLAGLVAVVDTNVLMDLYTLKGLDDAITAGNGLPYRRERARTAIWLFEALHERRASTLSAQSEAGRIVQRLAPPTSDAWAPFVIYHVKDRLLFDWDAKIIDADDEIQGSRVDTLLVELAALGGVPLITQEQGSIVEKCRARGVATFTPQHFALHLGVDYVGARERFLRRFDASIVEMAASSVADAWPKWNGSLYSLEKECCDSVKLCRRTFRWLLPEER